MNIMKTFVEEYWRIRVKSLFTPALPLPAPQPGRRSRGLLALASLALSLTAIVPCSAKAQGVLTNGWLNAGAISVGGETDTWTIASNPGDRIAVQIAKLSGGAGFTPRIEVFAPDGASLGIKSGGVAARLDLQASVGGTYTVAVSDATGTGTGTYGLQLAQIPRVFTIPSGDEGGPLTNGAIHQGTIALGDFDMWTVAANQGDRITLQIAKISGGAGFTPMIELFAPDGARLEVDSAGVVARLDAQSGITGTYTVLVSDANQTGTGGYQLQLAHLPGTFIIPAADEGGPLADAVDQDGTISLGDLDLWSFSASAGDRITLQITELTGGANFAPMIELFAPNGERKAVAQNASAATIDTAIEAGGTYTVLVSDANQIGAGTYRLHLTRGTIAPPGANVLTNGATFSGSIVSASETNLWTFTASVGETILVRVADLTTTAFAPSIRLLNPNGTLVGTASAAVSAEIAVTATNSGTFTVTVSDGTASHNQTGGYRLILVKPGSPVVISAADEGGPMTNGVMHTGTINVGDLDPWTFTANAGENIVVRIAELTSSTLLPWLRLYGPDGTLLTQNFNASAAEVTVRATNSGTFMVVVGDGNAGFGGIGNYRINLAKTGSPLVISPNDEGGPLVNGTTYLATIDIGDIDGWTFTANAGESIVVRMGETTTGANLLPWLRLYGPDGSLLTQNFNASAAEVTVRATNSGMFLVVVGDGNAGFAGTGNYRISLAKTGAPLVISPNDDGGPLINGTTYVGTIDTGDIDAWTFTANAGENIVVRMGETTTASPLLPWLRLYGPDGTLITQDFNAAAAEVTARATNSGTFIVVAGDGNAGFGSTGNYRISLAKTGSPLVISPNDEGGPMVNGTTYLATIDTGDIDAWTFTANAGDSIVVRAGETIAGSALVPWLRLYGPNGVLISQSFNAAVAEVTTRATNSGTFMVVAADGNAGLGGTGNYRLALARSGTPVVISAGDEGGPLNGAATYDATIDTGDIDVWTFTVCAGDTITINVTELVPNSPLTPWLRFYGLDGVLLKNLFAAATVGFTNFVAPASGTYTVVISDGSVSLAGTGTYRLSVNGLSDGLKLCIPAVAGGNVDVDTVGGVPGNTVVLLTSTNVAIPMAFWTPLRTNQFDSSGIFVYTSPLNLSGPQRFFRLFLQ